MVGNPPFASPLRGGAPGGMGAYTDQAGRFLVPLAEVLRAGGRVGLIQPQSVLTARDAEAVRAAVGEQAALRALWVAEEKVFSAVDPRGRRHCGKGRRCTARSPSTAERMSRRGVGDGLVGDAGRPGPGPAGGRLGRWADGRLVGHCHGGLPPPVLRAARPRHRGRLGPPAGDGGPDRPRPLRLGRAHDPHRGPDLVPADGRSGCPGAGAGEWFDARLVPKLLVASQTKVVEVVVDEAAGLLPSVPVVSVEAPVEHLWDLAAALRHPR